jgi:hypothetical protein
VLFAAPATRAHGQSRHAQRQKRALSELSAIHVKPAVLFAFKPHDDIGEALPARPNGWLVGSHGARRDDGLSWASCPYGPVPSHEWPNGIVYLMAGGTFELHRSSSARPASTAQPVHSPGSGPSQHGHTGGPSAEAPLAATEVRSRRPIGSRTGRRLRCTRNGKRGSVARTAPGWP